MKRYCIEWRKYTWLNKQGQMNEQREYTWLTHSKRHFLLILSWSCCSTMLESRALGHRPFSYHEMWAAIVLVPWQEFFPFIKHICNNNNLFIGYPNLFGSSFVIIVDIRRTERLDILDDNDHILNIRLIGGDHRLRVPN